jgi:hypothetical protein
MRWALVAVPMVIACSSGTRAAPCAPRYYYVSGDWAGPALGAGVVVGVGGWYDPRGDGSTDPVDDGSESAASNDQGGDDTSGGGTDNSGDNSGGDPSGDTSGGGDSTFAVTANSCAACTVVCSAGDGSAQHVNGATGWGTGHDAACTAAVGALEHWARPARLSACREVGKGDPRVAASPSVSATPPVGKLLTRLLR